MRALPLRLAALLLGAAPAAAGLTVDAQVSAETATLSDQIVLAVTVSGPHADLPEPRVPAMAAFSVYSSGRNQQISFVNGRLSGSVVHTFVLVPRSVGKAVVEPITVTGHGQTVKTQPITIEIRPPSAGAGQPAAPAPRSPQAGGRAQPGGPAPDVYVSAETDRQKAFVNEAVTLAVRFYYSVPLISNPEYTAPKISGFLAEDLPPERTGKTILHGREYFFSEIKTAIFPAAPGRLVISPAAVRVQIQRSADINPLSPDFIQRFFSQGLATGEEKVLRSEPVVIEAEALPAAGKPADFGGAVGRFSINAAVDRTAPKAGEAVTLTVTVSGTGNLKALGDAKLPDMPSWRIYETISSLNIDKKDDLVRGSKVFKTVIVPKVSGPLTIPPVTFSYFDPAQRQYLRASSLAIALQVGEGDASAAGAPSSSPAPAPAARVTSVGEDIRYLKKDPSRGTVGAFLAAVAGAGNAHSIPFLIFAAALALGQYREHLAADPQGARARRALRAASARLDAAGRLLSSDARAAAEAFSGSLAGFLGDKFRVPPSGLTLRRAVELLSSQRPPLETSLIEEVRDTWQELDSLRFAPKASLTHTRGSELAARLAELLKRIDKGMRA